jgi:hypothetical protein
MRITERGFDFLEIETEGGVTTYKFDILLLACEFRSAWIRADEEFGTSDTTVNEKTIALVKELNEIVKRYGLPEMSAYTVLEFGKHVMEWEGNETKKSEVTPTPSVEHG